ncbi:DUF2281 domain-containing protein [Candidatus Magnetomoraceae bacterium gMMP-15]
MSSAIETITKMMEPLPETAQNFIAERVKDYIEEIKDEIRWKSLFRKTENNLINAAKRAKQEIAKGHAKPMDYSRL